MTTDMPTYSAEEIVRRTEALVARAALIRQTVVDAADELAALTAELRTLLDEGKRHDCR